MSSALNPSPFKRSPFSGLLSSGDTDNYQIRVSTLENGLRVASKSRIGHICTVGVVIQAGSRFETGYINGVTHFLKYLAFGETQEFEEKKCNLDLLQKMGGVYDFQSSRDSLIYTVSAPSQCLDEVVEILGDVILRRKLTPSEISDTRLTVETEVEHFKNFQLHQESLLKEMIHAAAFRNNTVGLPKMCPKKNIALIDQGVIYSFLRTYYIPSRMVLVGIGVDHNVLVGSAHKYFVEKIPIWLQDQSLISAGLARRLDSSVAQYTGGMTQRHVESNEFVHFVLGVESCSHRHEDFIGTCVLRMMMGGGDPFSVGGPGKGMYTRLYTNLVSRFNFVLHAMSYNDVFSDSGLFYVHASSHPSYTRELVEAVTREFVAMAGAVDEMELIRAKQKLETMLIMNLENQSAILEDIGQQILANGEWARPELYMEKIHAIKAEDIQRIARQMLRSKPTVAAFGDLNNLPDYQSIESALTNTEGKLPNTGKE